MQTEEMKQVYRNIRLIATMLMLWVLSNGYHLFHYLGYKTKWYWIGYFITPILFTVLVWWVILKQRKSIRDLEIEPMGWPKKKWYLMVCYGLLFVGVAFISNWGWEYLNHIEYRYDLILDIELWGDRFGQPKGLLLMSVFYLSYFTKAYLAILIGYYAYHWVVPYGVNKAKVVMVLTWLITLGISETIYYGTKWGFITFISLVIGAILTLINEKYAHYVWLYVVLSFVF
ncbi:MULTISPECIES: hypothetical protein [unclassified Fusibacter]|uniref:hypothetical protein n=1 Tax=unclassified Fusibacter TaxID=2624464 RepID=UPI0010102BE2|nr:MULTISPECIES: hypothetical protein [unclassified Fusibacter]MCK8060967.1 hypothetical protein [Fusibacter sp. A2]NPE23263.1 hypothetical protein [Fusibacter sp. A1]RXV59616.1 hypothetical protein DWB64_15630 [Fusibacter sp. A1]